MKSTVVQYSGWHTRAGTRCVRLWKFTTWRFMCKRLTVYDLASYLSAPPRSLLPESIYWNYSEKGFCSQCALGSVFWDEYCLKDSDRKAVIVICTRAMGNLISCLQHYSRVDTTAIINLGRKKQRCQVRRGPEPRGLGRHARGLCPGSRTLKLHSCGI